MTPVMVSDNISTMVESTQSYFYTAIDKVVIPVVILLIGFSVGILAQKLMYRLLKELELNRLLRKVNIMYDVERWTGRAVSAIIYIITIVVFLKQLGITSFILDIILGAILILVILTIVVGLKDIIPNFVGWLFVQKQGHIQEGKRIEIREISGVVNHVGVLETEIKTDNDDVLYVPNSLFLKHRFWLRTKKEK